MRARSTMQTGRVLTVLVVLLCAGAAHSTIFPVTKTADTNDGTCDADCSLREAIIAANANPGGDDVIVPGGIYVLSLGHLRITDDLTLTGAGLGNTVIGGNGVSGVFDVGVPGSAVIVAMKDLFIRNGREFDGGCIRNNFGNTLTLTDTIVTGCVATHNGGGIHNAGTLTLIGTDPGCLTCSTVDQSQATAPFTGGDGGGIFNDSTLVPPSLLPSPGIVTLNNTFIGLNQASGNGGGILNHGTMTLNNSTLFQNAPGISASDRGAGIFQIRASDFHQQPTLTIIDSTLSDHAGVSRQTIRLDGGTAKISNTTLSDNVGTGLSVGEFARLTLFNSTISGNRVGISSSGLVGVSHSTVTGNTNGGVVGDVVLSHTIVANNGSSNCFFGVQSLGHNLDDDGSCPFTGAGDLSNVVDAKLGPLADNGGPTKTHALLAGSPALDAGTRGTDQRGLFRADGDGDTVPLSDIGAFEFGGQPQTVGVDHFKCYKAGPPKRTPKLNQLVSLSDQFEDKLFKITAANQLCNPVDKNGEGIRNPIAHLTCYQIRQESGQGKFVKRSVLVSNQFGDDQQLDVSGSQSLCVPSTKIDLGP